MCYSLLFAHYTFIIVNKTTLSFNLASCLQKTGLNIGVLDTDLQGSQTDLNDTLKGIKFVQYHERSNFGSIPYDFLIIDTPPYLTNSDSSSKVGEN